MSGRPFRSLRAGVTLPELILVAWLFALVLAAVAGFASSQARLTALAADRVRAGEAIRVAQIVLGAELRPLARADVAALARDSIRIRAIRGSGPICRAEGSELLVWYAGVRLPDPEKDSVLVLHDDSSAGEARGLVATASEPACGSLGLRLTLSGPTPATGGLALVFETGAYSLGSGALRYRRGAGGRQPLTEAVLAGGGFLTQDDARLTLELRFRPDSLPRVPNLHVPVELHLPNRAAP